MTHSHSFDPREEAPSALRQAAAQRSTWVSVAVNVLLSSVQVVVGLWANSQRTFLVVLKSNLPLHQMHQLFGNR